MNQVTEDKYRKALAEVFYIINTLTEELNKMIPKSFIESVENNMDKDYVITKDTIKQNGLSKEAEAILALIYRDFFCDDETRDAYIELDKQDLKAEEQKYNNIFKKAENNSILDVLDEKDENNQNNKMVLYKKENFLEKILNKIKKFFKIKKETFPK